MSWLHANALETRRSGKPFFMVASLLNPHDIMFADANVPGQAPVQRAIAPGAMPPLPTTSLYRQTWSFTLAPSLAESLTARGMPEALLEYRKGWLGWSGTIPTDRKDMWALYYNYYLNSIRDVDRSVQQIVDVLNDMDLWRDTVVVFTADHGEMAGAHGGQKGKGLFCYEANAHVPLLIAHPTCKAGSTCIAVTSHLDLLPTFVGLTGLPQADRPQAIKALPGHDFSALLADPEQAKVDAVRPGALFNYVGLSGNMFVGKPAPSVTQVKRDKRGFLSFVFDGRYKFARYYAPVAFNAPQTMEQILGDNDVQLFDLESDPDEMHNLALDPQRNQATILKMNQLLNDLIAKEVGVNNSDFLPSEIRSK